MSATELAGRAIQGIGAALIAPSALTLLMMLFGGNPKELTKALALYGAAAPAGGTAGVFLGGVITEYVSWPWVFYINVPIAVLALVATRGPDAGRQAGGNRGSVDVFGALTVTARPGRRRLWHCPRARGGLGRGTETLDRPRRRRSLARRLRDLSSHPA
jgi:MFS family permease